MSKPSEPWFYNQTGWWMTWIDGKKIKLAKGKKNKAAARRKLRAILHAADHNAAPQPARPSPDLTIAAVIEAYGNFAEKALAPSTVAAVKPYLQSFAEDYGELTISLAVPQHMEEWLLNHDEWVSDWTKNFAVRAVQRAFNWSVAKAKTIAVNPFRGVTHRPGQARRDMTRDEFQKILRATTNAERKHPYRKLTPAARFRQVLIYLYFTGCRPSEAAKLRWSDVNFEDSVVILEGHKTARTQSEPEPRIIPLDLVIVKLLRFLKARDEGEHVFVTFKKTPWTKDTLVQRMIRARTKAGVSNEAKLYGIRHAFGTRGVLRGLDLKSLSAVMGHTTTRVTERYVHIARRVSHLAASMRKINGRHQGI